ncbi:hypothetical protein EK904_013729, partial [Melospiza melodia maxima]
SISIRLCQEEKGGLLERTLQEHTPHPSPSSTSCQGTFFPLQCASAAAAVPGSPVSVHSMKLIQSLRRTQYGGTCPSRDAQNFFPCCCVDCFTFRLEAAEG